jgi:hypothetical protein
MNNDPAACYQCGEPFLTNVDGTTQHCDEDGNVNYDLDADHVPHGDPEFP